MFQRRFASVSIVVLVEEIQNYNDNNNATVRGKRKKNQGESEKEEGNIQRHKKVMIRVTQCILVTVF